MYGKNKIMLRKTGEIVLSGDRLYHPIGMYFYDANKLSYCGWFLKSSFQWDRRKTDENSILFQVKEKDNIRKEVLKEYPEQLN